MSHEMMQHDSAAYFAKPAWHGLGNVIEEAMSIPDALALSGLDWTIVKSNGINVSGVWTDEYTGIIRRDTNEVLGVVSPTYKVIQNEEVFELARHFGRDVKVESAGSIQNGRKVYLLLRGETFDAGKEDAVTKYMALFWGHDGTLSLTVLPTSVRVVCKNTLEQVIGESERSSNKISIKHAGDMEEKIAAAQEAIARFKDIGRFFEDKVKVLVGSDPSRSEINSFFAGIYKTITGNPIVVNPQNEKEEAVLLDATTRISKWIETMESEEASYGFGINYWTAANAVTNDIQHRIGTRGRKKTPASSAYANLIGKNSVDSRKVFNAALACA